VFESNHLPNILAKAETKPKEVLPDLIEVDFSQIDDCLRAKFLWCKIASYLEPFHGELYDKIMESCLIPENVVRLSFSFLVPNEKLTCCISREPGAGYSGKATFGDTILQSEGKSSKSCTAVLHFKIFKYLEDTYPTKFSLQDIEDGTGDRVVLSAGENRQRRVSDGDNTSGLLFEEATPTTPPEIVDGGDKKTQLPSATVAPEKNLSNDKKKVWNSQVAPPATGRVYGQRRQQPPVNGGWGAPSPGMGQYWGSPQYPPEAGPWTGKRKRSSYYAPNKRPNFLLQGGYHGY